MFAIVPATCFVAQCSLALLVPLDCRFRRDRLPASKEQMTELGRQHRTAWELYKAFEQQADGGQRLRGNELPDWSGVYTRGGIIFNFDADQGRNACRPRSSLRSTRSGCSTSSTGSSAASSSTR